MGDIIAWLVLWGSLSVTIGIVVGTAINRADHDGEF